MVLYCVPECAGDGRRWISRFRGSNGVRGRARQPSLACQEVGDVVLLHGALMMENGATA